MTAASISRAAAAVTVVLLAALHFIQPELNPGSRFLSDYANGRLGWMMTLAFVAWAVATGSLAVALQRRIRTIAGRIGLGMLAIATLGLVMAALCPVDGPGAPQGGTLRGMLHGVSALLGIPTVPLGAMLISIALLRHEPSSSRRVALLALGNLTWVTLALMVAYMVWAMRSGVTPSAGGWMNRLLVTSYLAWTMYVAHLVKSWTTPPTAAA